MTMQRHRSWWGWGWEDRALDDRACRDLAALIPGLPDTALGGAGSTTSTCARRASSRRPRSPTVAPPRRPIGSATPTASRTATSCGACTATCRARPTSSPSRDRGRRRRPARLVRRRGRRRRPLRRRQLGGRRRRVRRRRPTAAWCRIDLTGSTGCSRSTGSAGPPGSRPARSARSSRTSSARTGYTLRHFPQSLRVLDARRLAGHPLGRPLRHALHPHRRPRRVDARRHAARASASRGGCPARAPARRPTACSSARRASLGIITEAWMRVQDRPPFRASAGVTLRRLRRRASTRRAPIAQSGPVPDELPAARPGRGAPSGARRPAARACSCSAFESADHPVDASDRARRRARPRPRRHGRRRRPSASTTARGDATAGTADGAWRIGFLRVPYARDALARMSVIVETFETACTWDRFAALHAAVTAAAQRGAAARSAAARPGHLPLHPRLPRRPRALLQRVRRRVGRGSEVAMWDEIKAAASEALLAHGGTITHHHAVGRDHRPWYDRQRPDPFAAALRGGEAALDPAGILNPGVLIGR